MDTTLIVAIIGAVSTIVAGLGAAFISRRKASGSEEGHQAILHAALESNKQLVLLLTNRLSELEDAPRPKQPGETRFFQEKRELLEDNLKLIREMEATARPPSSGGEITIAVNDQTLVLVVQKGESRPLFNVTTTFTNDRHQVSVIDGLEAILKGPGGIDFRFQWRLFFRVEGGELHLKTSYVHPLVIPSHGSLQLGIQFMGPDFGMENLYSWPAGTYTVDITGWVNRNPNSGARNFSARYFIEISEMDIARLKQWIGWGDAEWAKFPSPDRPDPDKAAGHPVRMMSS